MSPEHIGFLITVMGLLGIMVWRERRITLLEGELKKIGKAGRPKTKRRYRRRR